MKHPHNREAGAPNEDQRKRKNKSNLMSHDFLIGDEASQLVPQVKKLLRPSGVLLCKHRNFQHNPQHEEETLRYAVLGQVDGEVAQSGHTKRSNESKKKIWMRRSGDPSSFSGRTDLGGIDYWR